MFIGLLAFRAISKWQMPTASAPSFCRSLMSWRLFRNEGIYNNNRIIIGTIRGASADASFLTTNDDFEEAKVIEQRFKKLAS